MSFDLSLTVNQSFEIERKRSDFLVIVPLKQGSQWADLSGKLI